MQGLDPTGRGEGVAAGKQPSRRGRGLGGRWPSPLRRGNGPFPGAREAEEGRRSLGPRGARGAPRPASVDSRAGAASRWAPGTLGQQGPHSHTSSPVRTGGGTRVRTWEPLTPSPVSVPGGRKACLFPPGSNSRPDSELLESCSQRRAFLGLWVDRAAGSSRNSLFEMKQKKRPVSEQRRRLARGSRAS